MTTDLSNAHVPAAQLGGMGSHQQLGPHGELIHYEGLYIYEKVRYSL